MRAAAGQFDLDAPDQLPRLLAVMTRRKVATQVRRHHAGRRDYRRVQALESGWEGAAGDSRPSQAVIFAELFQEFRSRLTDDERTLADLRSDGKSWAEIADALGGTPDARRMQLERVTRRIVGDLGLEEDLDA